jgi:hypothetical protein
MENTQTQEIDITELMNKLQKNTDSTAKLAETINMKFDEAGKWVANLAEVIKKPSSAPADEVKLEEAGVMSMKVAGLPVVGFAVGAFGAVFASELVDGLMSTQTKTTRGLVKAGSAFVIWKWGNKIPLIGKMMNGTGKNIFAVLLAFDAVRDLTPLDSWAASAANKISGLIPTGGLADQKGRDIRNSAVTQATRVVKDYYSKAEGR